MRAGGRVDGKGGFWIEIPSFNHLLQAPPQQESASNVQQGSKKEISMNGGIQIWKPMQLDTEIENILTKNIFVFRKVKCRFRSADL